MFTQAEPQRVSVWALVLTDLCFHGNGELPRVQVPLPHLLLEPLQRDREGGREKERGAGKGTVMGRVQLPCAVHHGKAKVSTLLRTQTY